MQVKSNLYDIRRVYKDCTVEILENSITGECSIGWWENSRPPMRLTEEDENDDCRTLSD